MLLMIMIQQYVEEALHRLVEINYKIGLEDESKKYAVLLGYNYQAVNGIKKVIEFLIKIMKKNKIKKEKKKKNY